MTWNFVNPGLMRVLERIFQLIVLTTILIFVLYTDILDKSLFKPLVWKHYIDDISLWSTKKATIESFIEKANNHHPTMKFTAEISAKETTLLDAYIYKGERFEKDAILDVRTHFKQTETSQYTHYSSCHPQGVKKGLIKGEALRLLRKNSSHTIFEEKIANFKAHLQKRGYPEALINTTLSEANFKNRKLALQQKPKTNQRILPFITQYQPSVTEKKVKQILMRH
ncbi:hypothetical protein AWC38_SpisGene25857 [Stylophora pistillata]|uniref:Helix-turn-helix domain-containing protein n=1 Tax=Stylophora pistillata TaxID=50429 RepID=A0A2B4RIX8_STYPI|nr:hypothetical protein AWC38_SpisGene25857 [Stylophora pistillata]